MNRTELRPDIHSPELHFQAFYTVRQKKGTNVILHTSFLILRETGECFHIH